MPAIDDNIDAITEERIDIAGSGRRLEGVLAYPQEQNPGFSVLFAGPHPFLGGDMQNNLVQYLLKGIAANGGLGLAFNYAGIGASEGGPSNWPVAMTNFWNEGRIDEERDWAQDACSAHYALSQLVTSPPVIIGYSFGCWVASQISKNLNARAHVLISPNPTRHDFDSLNKSTVPKLVVCSDNDFTCTPEKMKRWYDHLREPKSLALIHAGEHFFRGQEEAVLNSVVAFLQQSQIICPEVQ